MYERQVSKKSLMIELSVKLEQVQKTCFTKKKRFIDHPELRFSR